MTFQPTPADKFTFGLWTVGNRGRDPFGDFVRPALDPCESVRRLADLGAWGVNFHDNDLVPIDATAGRARPHRARLPRARSTPPGMTVPMATTNLFTDPVFKDGAFTSHDPQVRAYALQKTMRAMDLGVELGARTYVFWGGREGAEVDAAKDPIEAIKRFRFAIDFLCEYARDQKYDLRFALEAKPNEPRGDIYFPTTAAYLGFINTLAHPDMVGVNPEFAHEQMAGLNFFHVVAQAHRGRQAVSHRPERSEARPLRSGPALRIGVDQAAVLPGETARGVGLRRPAALRRACLPHRGRGGRLGLRRAAACGRI